MDYGDPNNLEDTFKWQQNIRESMCVGKSNEINPDAKDFNDFTDYIAGLPNIPQMKRIEFYKDNSVILGF